MTELAAGLSLGLGAGLSPGPLLTLVVTSSLERGFGAGLRVALAPLVTDAPIVLLSVVVVSSIPGGVLQGIGMTGGVLVAALGVVTVRSAGRLTSDPAPAGAQRDLWRGVLVNALSPHPWVFWLTAGGPLVVAAWRRSPAVGLAFLAGFYLLLVGSKVAIAYAVARAGRHLGDGARRALLVAGGLLLIGGGALLGWQAASGRL